jgi:hypothetical protein
MRSDIHDIATAIGIGIGINGTVSTLHWLLLPGERRCPRNFSVDFISLHFIVNALVQCLSRVQQVV